MSEEDDRAEIVALIHANRIGIWTKNYDLWSSCFVHAPYITRWGYNVQGGPFVRRSWEELARRAVSVFSGDEMPYDADFAHKTTVENLTLRIYGDMAWAAFDQQYPPSGHPGFRGSGLTHELRVFERHEGRWKIAVLGHMGNDGFHDGAAILELNAEGTVRWASAEAVRRLEEDDDLVIRNGRLRVRDTACQRRLTAALSWASNVDSGYNSGRGSLPIVHETGEGLPTRVWWVQVQGGTIYFLMEGQGLTETRLDLAAAIYGLSAGQRRLAGLIADGQTLPDAAREMDISANTAKTHLQRIYDKTGVHTQPALMRVLLSVGIPA
ncbi:helix-turn-helix transcriptional regulator [Devosia sp.]|uniref:helix-turn-helix transcriptional regulator n=1 Tax=Devosia sp. TaxID=1871048 RepID=UPI0025E6CD25|nr:helix-turn-helix transcriptional regulator [Devosia sp.]MCR6633423.1 helix-turn-helix transcriptional regulator [Devosia sp.]